MAGNIAALSVRIENNDQCYAHMIATACLVNTDAHRPEFGCNKGEIDYPWSHDEENNWMEGFRVYSQSNVKDGERGFYGFDCQYRDLYLIELRHAERIVKHLKKVEKSLQKQRDQWGYPLTVSDFIFRVAKACGCKLLLFKNDVDAFHRTGYAYRCVAVDGDGLSAIRRLEESFTKPQEIEQHLEFAE